MPSSTSYHRVIIYTLPCHRLHHLTMSSSTPYHAIAYTSSHHVIIYTLPNMPSVIRTLRLCPRVMAQQHKTMLTCHVTGTHLDYAIWSRDSKTLRVWYDIVSCDSKTLRVCYRDIENMLSGHVTARH
eukprot:1309889-Amorphochlora_amoeboformis.AAC.1